MLIGMKVSLTDGCFLYCGAYLVYAAAFHRLPILGRVFTFCAIDSDGFTLSYIKVLKNETGMVISKVQKM